MRISDTLILFGYAFGMSLGQILFKASADTAKAASVQGAFWSALLRTPTFYLALFTYGGLTLVWVWILSRVELSKAYPFVALAFITTPLGAALLFGEKLDLWYFLSLLLILGGLALLMWKGTV
jgi:drug/metabolite transporter (DMT)-like permease